MPGPTAPMTKRVRPSPANSSTRFARQLGGTLVERHRLLSAMPNSPRVSGEPPKLLVWIASDPASRVAAMDIEHQIGPALIEDLGAILMAPIILVEAKRHRLDTRTGRAIAEQHLVGEKVENMRHRLYSAYAPAAAGPAPDAEHATDRHREIGAVQRIEMKLARPASPAAAGIARPRSSAGTSRARLGIVVEPVESARSRPAPRRRSARRISSSARNW